MVEVAHGGLKGFILREVFGVVSEYVAKLKASIILR